MLLNPPRISRINSLLPPLAKRYDNAAKKWHAAICRHGYLDAYARLIGSALPLISAGSTAAPLKVLDAGAGTGGFSLALCELANNPIDLDLLDISSEMLQIAAQNLSNIDQHSSSICASVEELLPASGPYDLILCAHTIDHCANPGDVLNRLHECLAPGGVLLLAVSKPYWCTAIVQLRWHHRAYDEKTVHKMLENSGFEGSTSFAFSKGPPKFMSLGYIAQTSQ